MFEINQRSAKARAGTLSLFHGVVSTPVFMPIGTYGVVRGILPEDLDDLGVPILLANAFHLVLRPGPEILKAFNGLHAFMGWNKPILTDSGGFQVFSLDSFRKVSDEGVSFRSPLDGNLIFLSPERSAEIQGIIGSDIAMVLDECIRLPADKKSIEKSVERSLRWAKRFLNTKGPEHQKRFGIVQGGTDLELRRRSLEETTCLPIDGLAIGGLSVGESFSARLEVLHDLSSVLPEKLPHYLMGVGTPRDILHAVREGIDMFDCVLPTRNGRNGGFFTDEGLLNIRNSHYAKDPSPIDDGCSCLTCRKFSRAYLRHLFLMKDMLGCRLATLHNLHYYQRFTSRIRDAICSGHFESFFAEWSVKLSQSYPDKGEEVV